jgi:DNA-binding CsgD family transcriptional regulator
VTRQQYVGGSGKLHVDQVHQLLRLLNEAREIPAESPQREHYLVSGVARIIGAAVAGVILDTGSVSDGRSQRSAIPLFKLDSATLLAPEQLNQAANALQPLVLAMVRLTSCEPGATVTATWHELATERRWCCAAQMMPYLRPRGFGDAMFSAVRLRAPSHVHGLGLYRGPEDQPFGEEERNLVHVFHAECDGLLRSLTQGDGGADDDDAVCASLSLRQRQTLALVLSGLSDKEIAGRLGISRYTVNQYTKVIYRHYGVTGRIQLLARLLVQPHARSLIIGTDIASAVP